jgi:hypothetical protein
VSADNAEGTASERPVDSTTVRRDDLPPRREVVWRLTSDASHSSHWWQCLRLFSGGALAQGAEWRSEVQPPVPSSVRFLAVIAAPNPRIEPAWVLDSGARRFIACAIDPLVRHETALA